MHAVGRAFKQQMHNPDFEDGLSETNSGDNSSARSGNSNGSSNDPNDSRDDSPHARRRKDTKVSFEGSSDIPEPEASPKPGGANPAPIQSQTSIFGLLFGQQPQPALAASAGVRPMEALEA